MKTFDEVLADGAAKHKAMKASLEARFSRCRLGCALIRLKIYHGMDSIEAIPFIYYRVESGQNIMDIA